MWSKKDIDRKLKKKFLNYLKCSCGYSPLNHFRNIIGGEATTSHLLPKRDPPQCKEKRGCLYAISSTCRDFFCPRIRPKSAIKREIIFTRTISISQQMD